MTKHMKILLLSTVFAFTLLTGVKTANAINQTPLQNIQKDKNTAIIYVVYGDNGEIEQLSSYPAYQENLQEKICVND
ncbi:hypothetical protein BEI59_22685 [Eisenbergiella tayi]|jgi:hypothetical protein|uniref:Uncharacterized protein n=1 Tax=Eisenbergiella tayi TaxID=1432052 RepID=A0A1E3UCI0_9FIRM|nr:hypothetical protein [Eisenbergiella tayi]ODR47482.1 hypothetical protein BEI59_22685 [Eisenbergiella tayi]